MSGERAKPEVAALLGALVVHDVANLLAVADSSAFLISRAPEDVEAVRRHTARVREKLQLAKSLCVRCLAVARGEPALKLEHALVTTARRAWDSAEAEGRCRLNLEVAQEAQVYAEPLLLEAVLMNLMRNAVEAGAKSMRLVLQQSEETSLIELFDDGAGFEREPEPLRSGKSEGHGFGLAASRAIVELHGGELGLERLERETRAFIALPAVLRTSG